jgi:hypothetical protein
LKLELEATPHAVALALILAAFAVGIWAYLTRYPVLPGRRRAILLATRLLALLALLVASLAPVLRYPESSRARNRLLVLVDHSGSMQVRDVLGGRSRRAAADSAAASVAGELGRRYDVRTAAFDASLGPFGRDARASSEAFPGGGETALGDALRATLRRVDPDSVVAVLVLSDGIVNRGEDPERALGAALPAFALAVGSRSDPPTVGIAGVEVPSEMIVGRPTPIVVTVRQGARPASSGVVRVSEEGRELGRATFSLSGASASTRATIPVTVQSRGKRFLEVELSGIEDDPVRENKRRLVAVEARPWKRSVVILSPSWDWDLRSLARGVEEDTTIAVTRAIPAGGSQVVRLHEGPGALGSLLESAEAAVVRYDASTITPERADVLMRYLNGGGGLLLWIDPRPRTPLDSPLTRALGLQWRFLAQPIGPTATADLAPAGRTHEVALLGRDAAGAATTWKDLPPVEPIVLLGTSGSPLQPIVVGRIGTETVPLVLAGTVGKGRVVFLNAAGVYRWGITASGIAGKAGIESAFFGGAIRWLSGGEESRPVRVAAPDITPEGRPVAVRVTASLPAAALAGAEARIVARAQGAARGRAPVEAALSPEGTGEFAGSVSLPPGTYLLQGRVSRAGRLLGTDSVRVAVGVQGIEFETLAADPGTLRRLAERSGGLAAPLDSAGPVLERLRSPEMMRVRLAEMDLFHNPLLFAVLILALTLEWALRKRFHLM